MPRSATGESWDTKHWCDTGFRGTRMVISVVADEPVTYAMTSYGGVSDDHSLIRRRQDRHLDVLWRLQGCASSVGHMRVPSEDADILGGWLPDDEDVTYWVVAVASEVYDL